MDYSSFVTQLAGLMVYRTTDPNFVAMLPDAIKSAELRIYRDLNLLDTTARDSSLITTAGSRFLDFGALSNPFVVVEDVNLITPSGVGSIETGLRNPLTRISRSYLDIQYPSSAGAALPEYYALDTNQRMVFGPWPDDAYKVEIVGTTRPTPLSTSNTETLLTEFFPDLFICAAMIYASGWMRNFGTQADDPKLAVSWSQQYQELIGSASIEEMRKRAIESGAGG